MVRSVLLLGAWFASDVAAFGGLPSITAAPVLDVINAAVTDAGFSACLTAEAAIGSCASALDDLNAVPESQLARCLCCSGSSWSPELFDGSAESCASWIETSLPQSTSQYTAYSVLADFCQGEGDVCNVTATATGTRSGTTSTITSAPYGCAYALAVLSGCASETPGLITEPGASRAVCYCYLTTNNTTTWVPDVFDGYASECADWASTADTADYPGWSGCATFCSAAGDILTAATTSRGSVRTTSSTPTAAQTGQSSSGTTSRATAVTVTVSPTTTSANAAGALYNGQEYASFGVAGLVMALFSYFL